MGKNLINEEEHKERIIKFYINEKKLIGILTLNALLFIFTFFILDFFNYSFVHSILCVVIGVTLAVLANYFIITKLRFIENNIIESVVEDEFEDIQEFQTVMR